MKAGRVPVRGLTLMVLIVPARPEDAAAIAAVHVDSWRETYEGIMPDWVLGSLSVADRTDLWRRVLSGGGWVLLARDGGPKGAVVGFVNGGPLRDAGARPHDGEVGGLYLRRSHQGCGGGRALMAAAVRRLAVQGMTRLFVWVLADNRVARGFYERLGGVADRSQHDVIGGTRLREVRYRWDHLPRL